MIGKLKSNTKYRQLEDAHCIAYWRWVLFSKNQDKVICIEHRGARTIQHAMKLKRKGMVKGIADYLLLSPTEMSLSKGLWLEFKALGGRQSPDQKKFQKNVESLGYRYKIAWDAEEAVNISKMWFKCGI